MSTAVWPLLKSRRFAPLFVTQFLGAFNDNLLKSGLAFFITTGKIDYVEVARLCSQSDTLHPNYEQAVQ